jgi:hypothetical protein
LISSNVLDELYFEWLFKSVSFNHKETYLSLCEQLYHTDFKWFVPNDDNRVEDGRLLRSDFLDESKLYTESDDWFIRDCSMLELILGISYRLSFESTVEHDIWFWEILENLNLTKYTDSFYTEGSYKEIDRILQKINKRTYRANGEGGLFPLRYASEDQRKIEIWYQMSAYLLENNFMSE